MWEWLKAKMKKKSTPLKLIKPRPEESEELSKRLENDLEAESEVHQELGTSNYYDDMEWRPGFWATR